MPDKKEPFKIGIKYCGGCKPAYDRLEQVRELQRRLAGRIELLPPESEGVRLVLAVQGCPTACADLRPFSRQRVWSITCPEEAEKFVACIESCLTE